jgi:Ca2+-binding RTX toxin-like protein
MPIIGSVDLDGTITEWTGSDLLLGSVPGLEGYEIYGRVTAGHYVIALLAPVEIGPATTIWLNVDQNPATGYQIFGFAGGAEYNVDIALDGTIGLYTGGAGEIPVPPVSTAGLLSAASADRRILEIAIPQALVGAASAIDTLYDFNDTVFAPLSYASGQLEIRDRESPPPVFGEVTLDGALGEWATDERIDRLDGTPGYEVYGEVAADHYIIALKTDGTPVGPGTTIWLNTDQNPATGHQIFGFAGGAEFNIDFDAAGRPRLYTGGAGETLVSTAIPSARSADGSVIEIAIPKALIGTPPAVNVLLDVNNEVFLPGSFSGAQYTIRDPDALPARTDFSHKIAIVYSETSARLFFNTGNEDINKTAYSQLFMAAQNQAAMAGVPFDVISETDLTDIARLVNYDAIVFPSFRSVPAELAAPIETTLATLSQHYGISLVAAGDFMTNDATGAPLPGDSYARMKLLFDLTRSDGGTGIVTVNAAEVTHPVMEGFAPGEQIRVYNGFDGNGIGWATFTDASPGASEATVLATQTVGGATHSAILATTNGGRNVHFSTESLLGDNNQLWQAIDWAVNGTGPTVGLQMSRATSIVASRNDMDQSQEAFDVRPDDASPGIYDVLLPILEQWKAAYNFVGSYYVNVGNNPPDQTTDWAVSGPYYQRLLAMGSEIGSHSYTHPHDTNVLTPAEIAFEFGASRQIIEQQLGVPVTGAAVPGAPERLPTSLEILQYYEYLTGGYAGVGAGFPGGFGYLTPATADKVYLAPNMSFDFTLVGFQGRTAEEAAAIWGQEWADLVRHAEVPVVLWPWHDYGPTRWVLDEGEASRYTTEMFTSFIATAAAAGAEFVTLADLARRIESFETAAVSFEVAGSTITATLQSADAGKFALDVDGIGTSVIASVDGWYAYDTDSVFTPRNGGTFTIRLGTDALDITHITRLAARSELLSVTGDGASLAFSFIGEGAVAVDLADPTARQVLIRGATSAALAGDQLELTFAGAPTLERNAAVTLAASALGTAADEILIGILGSDALLSGGAGNDRIDGRAGDDTLAGGTGNDTLIGGTGIDTAVFSGRRGDYLVTVEADGSVTLADRRAGAADGTDTLAGVEFARFSNGTFTVASLATLPNEITGTAGNDVLTGTLGSDLITGLAGNDLMRGLDGDDLIDGAGGADTLDGGDGADVLIGGTGNDVYIVDALDTIAEFAGQGTDTVETALADYTLADHLERLTYTGQGDFRGSGNGAANTITGGAGNDTLDGGAGADRLAGGLGDDTYVVAETGDTVSELAGQGTDTILTGRASLTLSSNVENLAYTGSATFNGSGNALANAITGGTGNDTLNGNGGDDTLSGGAGNDLLLGSGGADRLIGGSGNDTLDGGAGNDTVVFEAGFGSDVVRAFGDSGTNQDVLAFSSVLFADYAALSAAMTQVGSGVVISVTATDLVTIQNVQISNLGSDDFVFI